MNGLIQGKDAILCFYKNGFVPYLCASDISVTLSSDELPIRTKTANGKGHWKKVTYQNASYTISLSGLLMFAVITDFNGGDIIDNWLNFAHIGFRIAFTDEQGFTRSMQGECMVRTNAIAISTSQLVKADFDLTGNGELMIFDGLVPCDTAITSITITGQTAPDGIMHITYTYTGAPYQVKYRIDGTGKYIYALIDEPIEIPGLSLGNHDIEMIPVCTNNYEGTAGTEDMVVTQSLTCGAVIDDITITTTTATPHVSAGTPPGYFYSIDGSTPGFNLIGTPVSILGLSAGAHSITMTPECSNGLTGTGFTKAFTVASQPAQSQVDWQLASFVSGNTLQIFVNGIMVLSQTTPTTGSITVATGDSVIGRLLANNNTGSTGTLRTQDTTLATVLDTRNGTAPTTLQYTFTANGDTYSILGTVTP